MLKRKLIIISSLIVILVSLVAVFSVLAYKQANLKALRARKQELIDKLPKLALLNDVLVRGYVNVYFDLAKIYFEEKDFDKAIQSYERGLQIDSWRTDMVFELACAYKSKGLYSQAKERFNQVLALKTSPVTFLRAKWELFNLRNKVSDLKEDALIKQNKLKDLIVYILPFKVADIDMLEDLRVLLQDRFKFRFSILKSLPEPAEGFDQNRNQYFVDPLFKYVNREYESVFFVPDTQAIMIVTSFDITEQGLNFIFGRTDPQMRLGIVSFNRFLAGNPSKEVLFKRLLTQCLSTGGFLLGLPRCSSPGCARSYPHSFQEFKRKSYNLCKECQNNLNKLLEKIKKYPEVDWTKEDLDRLQAVKNKYNL